MNLIDLTGQRFGSLVVLEQDKSYTKNARWICKCDCGTIVSKAGTGLRNGETVCCDSRKCPNKKERFENLRGERFGRLLVIEPTLKRINGSVVWKCLCDCGNDFYVASKNLKEGSTRSCGCLKKETDKLPKGNTIDMLNKKYGHLTVIKQDKSDSRGEAKWICECDCESHTHISVLGSNLRSGHTTSCGCDRRSHGEQKIANLLIENNIPFETQKSFFKYDNGHSAPFDFYIDNKYIIEYDGETHDLKYATKHGWLTTESITNQINRDNIKNQWCINNNIPLIRIPYTRYKDLSIEDLKLETTTFLLKY